VSLRRREPDAPRPVRPTGRPHWAGRIEDRFNAVLVASLLRRGWEPRVVGYTGYGRPGWIRVLGRVLVSRPGQPQEDAGPPVGEHAPVGEHLAAAAVSALRGWRSFVSAPVRGTAVDVEVGGVRHRLVSGRGGYLDARLPSDLPAGEHVVTMSVAAAGDPAPEEVAEVSEGAEGVVDEPALVVEVTVVVVGDDQRLGVVSDIDDTVMVTSLPRPLIAAWNTFVLHEQARRPVPGMAQLLTAAAAQAPGVPVVYLSTGAWNIAPVLTRFMARHGFPAGPLLLTDWGPTNTGWFRSGSEHKRAALRRLREELPHLRWLLVGDDGQHDPEIYTEFAAEAPEAVRGIAIRQLTATEQVLSHGRPVPTSSPGAPRRPPVPDVRAPDGDGLSHQLRQAGLL